MPIKDSRNAEFSFIIPTYTNTVGLHNVVEDIAKFYPESGVVIVNNNPALTLEDKDFEKGQVVILNNSKNEGFAKASNDGFSKARELFASSYVVFLNDDVRFALDWVHPTLTKIKRRGWVAGAPVLLDLKGKVENYGYRVLAYGRVGLVLDKNDRKTDGLTAAALVFETKTFETLGGFDERFFMYLEDVDLFLRLKKLGGKFGILPELKVSHEGQKTSSQFKTKKAFLDFQNWILLILKNWTTMQLISNLPAIIVERLRNLWGVVKTLR